MNYDEAKQLLLRHGSGVPDGDPAAYDDGFLGSLLPYTGLIERTFHQVMEALLVVGERIHNSTQVDRDLVESLWSMCLLARLSGLEPDGMLQRNRLITPADVERLRAWIDTIERTALALLNGNSPEGVVYRYARYIFDVGWWDNVDFFIPLMRRALSDPDSSDPSDLVHALGKLGSRARSALPELYAAAAREYDWYQPADRCTAEMRDHLTRAIRAIEAAP